MASLTCSDFEQFAAALDGVDGRYLLLAPATHEWKLQIVDLGGLVVMQGQDGAANLFHASCHAGVCTLFVPLCAADGVCVNGESLGRGVCWLPGGAEFHMRANGAQQWIAVTIQFAMLEPLLEDTSRRFLEHTRCGRASPAAVSYLLILVRQALAVDPCVDSPDSGTLKRALASAFVSVMTTIDVVSDQQRGRPSLSRQVVIKRALQAITLDPSRMCHLRNLSVATGVSERTLQSVFRQHFGLSAYQYIMMRRLHDIHAAIRSASEQSSVTEICADHGVTDYGRLARDYRRAFGLPPSQMLTMQRRAGRGAKL